MTGSSDGLPSWPELFEHAPCGLLLTDPNGTIRLVNATFCNWTGYLPGELIGLRRIQDMYTLGARLFHQTHWFPLMQMQGSVAEVKLEVVHRDGHRIPMLFNAVSRKHGSGVFHELAVVVVHDRHKYERELLLARKNAETALAEQHKAQQALALSRDELARAHQRKDEFLATLGHELRSPLSSLRNVVAILAQQSSPDSHLDRLYAILKRQIDYLTRLVGDLLEVSRIAQGKLELHFQRIELASVVRDAVELVQSPILAAMQDLKVTLPAQPLVLDADPVRLTQILLNLLHNATKYTPHGGHIALTVTHEDGCAFICVRDSGVGIAPEYLDKVFDMFSQAAPMADRSQGGLGIGLALVRGLVDLHGGAIEARSDGPGQGSEFVVRLPMLEVTEPTGELPSDRRGPSPQAHCRIVVVDDNQDAADSLAMLLELDGHEVCTANDGVAALQLTQDRHAQAVLLDIGLPGMDGYEVARRIRREPWGKNILLVAVSGWGQEQDKLAAVDAGFNHHLTKPINFDELKALLTSIWDS